MPPRKRTRLSGVADAPPTQAPRRPSSVTPSTSSQRTPVAKTIEPVYRTRHRRVVRGPEVAAREGGKDDLVPPSDDDEYDDWRAVRSVERAELENDHENAVAGPSSQPSTATTATIPFGSFYQDWVSSDSEIEDEPRLPSRKGKERALVDDVGSPTRAVAVRSRSPRRASSPIAYSPIRAVSSLPPDPMPPEGPGPPDQDEAVVIEAGAGGSWASLALEELPVPSEMVRDYEARDSDPRSQERVGRVAEDLEGGPEDRVEVVSLQPTPAVHDFLPDVGSDDSSSDEYPSLEIALLRAEDKSRHRVTSVSPARSHDHSATPQRTSPIRSEVRMSQSPLNAQTGLASPPPLQPSTPSTRHRSIPRSAGLSNPPSVVPAGHGATPTPASVRSSRTALASRAEQRVRSPAPETPVPSSSPDALDLLGAGDNRYNLGRTPNNANGTILPTSQRFTASPLPSQQLASKQPQPQPLQSASQVPSIRPNAQPEVVVTDPRLLEFRSARTFRTRTALQLQPYTKEKQLYESVLRRGGLSKGRRGVAPASQIRAAADDQNVDDPASLGEDSSSDDNVAPEAIVIGDTQSHPTRPPRPPKELVDADFDDYFFKFGEVAVEEDELVQRRLQAIARIRLRAVKQAKRQERAAERLRRDFEALMREDEKERKAKEKEERLKLKESNAKEREERQRLKAAMLEAKEARRKEKEARGEIVRKAPPPKTPATKNPPKNNSTTAKRSARTTGKGPRTYGRKRETGARRAPQSGSDSPLSSAPPSPSTTTRQAGVASPSKSTGPASPPSFSLPSSPQFMGHDFGGVPDFDAPDFDAPDFDAPDFDDDAPNFPSLNGSTETRVPGRRTPGSTKRRRVIESSSQSSDESDADAARNAPGDRRRRIAGRMLPRALLMRLESEADKKQRAREERRRAAVRSESPVRRGHAVVRRGGGVELNQMTDLFDNSASDDSVQEIHALEAEEGSDGSNSDGSLGRPVVLSDSSGSEAMEDNRHNDGLARLQDGDFESIVHGRAGQDSRHQAERRQHRDKDKQRRRSRDRRPALGLVKTIRAPGQEPKRLKQSRIDFGAADSPRRAAGKSKSKHRSRLSHDSRSLGPRKKARPAIRLDDHVIFANDDFDFPSASEAEAEIASRPAPKRALANVTLRGDGHLARRTVSPSPAPSPAGPSARLQLDEGVGKARSWANFDKFPIDFDITPLPSGVFCADMIPSTDLVGFLTTLRGESAIDIKPVTAYGVTLHSEMPVDEVLAVIPIVLGGVYDSIQAFVDAPTGGRKPNLAPLTFVRDYLARADDDFLSLLSPELRKLSDRLDSIAFSGVKHERPLIEQVLLARYALFEIAATAGDNLLATGADVIDLLLIYGFDRSVRSLRRILRGEAETPEVKDISVAIWVAVMHILDVRQLDSTEDLFVATLSRVLDRRYSQEVGPLAAERVWFLIFGLCALSQFGPDGAVCTEYAPQPRWALVKRALSLIKVAHSHEAEESARYDQLQGRDRYIKTMVARCLRLSSTWKWSFDRSSFSVATRDLGMIFKERQHRNLPTEMPADFPPFISEFDISLTASDEIRGASAFELWLRLASVAASDVIASAEELAEAQQAERDVQRLIMSIFPLSAVPFTREKPPTARQLSALVNRYSTMVVACYFSPSTLTWLLANSQKWLSFERADFNSRQICIRGLMYLAVACRHHGRPLDPVVARLADILAALQGELESLSRPPQAQLMPTRVEIERTMVLVVSCFRQIILHPGYATPPAPVYPDPSLLHECWTARIFKLDLAKDVKSGLEIVSTIQAFLDARSAVLPKRARHARETRQKESLDDYPSLGFDFDAIDLAALGGDEAPADPVEAKDEAFAKVSLCEA